MTFEEPIPRTIGQCRGIIEHSESMASQAHGVVRRYYENRAARAARLLAWLEKGRN